VAGQRCGPVRRQPAQMESSVVQKQARTACAESLRVFVERGHTPLPSHAFTTSARWALCAEYIVAPAAPWLRERRLLESTTTYSRFSLGQPLRLTRTVYASRRPSGRPSFLSQMLMCERNPVDVPRTQPNAQSSGTRSADPTTPARRRCGLGEVGTDGRSCVHGSRKSSLRRRPSPLCGASAQAPRDRCTQECARGHSR